MAQGLPSPRGSTMLSTQGLYIDYPVSIRIDGEVEHSSVALSFVSRSDVQVPCTVPPGCGRLLSSPVMFVSGPVTVYTDSGSYRSSFKMRVQSINGHDVVLGRDWIHACQCRVSGGRVVDPLPGAALAAGHEWQRWGQSDLLRSVTLSPRSRVEQISLSSSMHEELQSEPTSSGSSVRSTTYQTSVPSATLVASSSFVSESQISAPGSLSDATCRGDRLHVSGGGNGAAVASSSLPSTSSATQGFSTFQTVIPESELSVSDVPQLLGLKMAQLECNAQAHGIVVDSQTSKDHLTDTLIHHISMGECVNKHFPGCRAINARYMYAQFDASLEEHMLEARIAYLKSVAPFMNKKPLRKVLLAQGVECPVSDSKGILRNKAKALVRELRKGKRNELRRDRYAQTVAEREVAHARVAHDISADWPQTVPQSHKDKLLALFREATSSKTLASFACGSCGQLCPMSKQESISWDDPCLQILRIREDETGGLYRRLDPFRETKLAEIILCPEGVNVPGEQVLVCAPCYRSLFRKKMPALALANGLWTGPLPPELQDLTQVEESLIALCRAKCAIMYLKNDGVDECRALPNMQRSLKGNVIEYPQKPGRLASVLPPPIADVLTSICIIFVGANPPTKEWLLRKAKPLAVRREKVRKALVWLKENNALYRDVELDFSVVDQLPENGTLPHSIEFMESTEAVEAAVARYDGVPPPVATSSESDVEPGASGISHTSEIPFRSVVITDVDANAPAHKLRAAAVRHFKEKKGYVEVPHDTDPVNEFCSPSLFPMLYPTLYPYGVGGFEDRSRVSAVSLKRHAAHLLQWADARFQKHSSFLFVVFNILQRREVLLRSSLKVQKASFARVASDFRNVSLTAIASVCERMSKQEYQRAFNPEEKKVLALMKEVNLVTSSLPGSSSARLSMRNQLRGMMMEHGLPSFYLTINPADVYNPVVKFLAGSEIDLDNMTPEEIPKYWEQSILVAKNPFVAAKFFNLYINTFIETLLGFDKGKRTFKDEGGVLGHVKAYYGCVEAQGRGSLHCHMVIWLEGALNPNEIRDRVLAGDDDFGRRMLAYLDDCISNAIPKYPEAVPVPDEEARVHPCHLRGVDLSLPDDVQKLARRADLHFLVRECQVHKHSATCWKYCRPGEPKTCRFDLDPKNTCEKSSFNAETGDLCLRCLDGMVNNFNETILEAMRCNMDIKFIGSGEAAKAIMFYVTNYITKPQMKAHVAYATLELAINRLSMQEVGETDTQAYGRKLLRKCAFSLLTQQELSAQQVASYLCNYDDYYSSHDFVNFYWTNFERYIQTLHPSPECYPGGKKAPAPDKDGDVEMAEIHPEPLIDQHREAAETDNEVDEGPDDNESEQLESDELGDEGGVMLDDSQEGAELELPSAEVLADELVLGVNDAGEVVAKADQVCDYVNRPAALSCMNVWDYVQCIRKCDTTRGRRDQDFCEVDEEGEEDHGGEEIARTVLNDTELRQILQNTGHKRPYAKLSQGHPEHKWKMLRVRHPSDRPVLVPIGPAIPRRDRPEARARYCRLMLILFKPWRTIEDLQGHLSEWNDAFVAFEETCRERIRQVMNNMQLLHECRDSGIDHFRNGAHLRRMRFGENIQTGTFVELDLAEEADEEEILRHVAAQEDVGTLAPMGLTQDALECVAAAMDNGLYDRAQGEAPNECGECTFLAEEFDLEKQWNGMYHGRKALWKQKTKATEDVPTNHGSQPTPAASSSASERSVVQSIDSGLRYDREFREQLLADTRIVVGAGREQSAVDADINATIEAWTLNAEQARAFKIIAHHSATGTSEMNQLKMYLGGPGGTGKSRVINALRDFFNKRGQARRFRLSSFTGVASRNIEGMTLHAALCLNKSTTRAKPGSRTHQDLQALWEGVDYLFVDEVSMIGAFLMARVSEALCLAKGSSEPFGGVNVIFAGDFAQLPPVAEAKLFGPMRAQASGSNGESKGHRSIFGKLLWLSIDTVVILHQSMRQAGSANKRFAELLSRLRLGNCSDEDYELLKQRVLKRSHLRNKDWEDAPVIVFDNASKDALNARAVEAYARACGRPLHWYYCSDRHKDRQLVGDALREVLYRQPSGKTSGLLGRIPLVIGMKVVVSRNFDVEGGILNGSIGTLRSVRYTVDDNGLRHLKSCVVHLPESDAERVPGLGEREFPILEEKKDWTVVDRFSKRRLVLSRTQVPIQPAYAFTCHRAQGQTYRHVVVDLESCRGHEAPYVMLSRATSLDGVLILRPFGKDKITKSIDGTLSDELKRLQILNKRTTIRLIRAAGVAGDVVSLSANGTLPDGICDSIPTDLEDRQHLLERLEDDIMNLVGSSSARNGEAAPRRASKRKQKSVQGGQRKKPRGSGS